MEYPFLNLNDDTMQVNVPALIRYPECNKPIKYYELYIAQQHQCDYPEIAEYNHASRLMRNRIHAHNYADQQRTFYSL